MKPKYTALVATLAACWLPSMSAHAGWMPDFTFSGFGTLGGVMTDTNSGEYIREQQAAGADRAGSVNVDSNLGLQTDVKVTNWLSGTVQTLTAQRVTDAMSTRIEWAFVKVQPLNGLALRAGKFSLPNFLISDSRRVGYANTALRPANEVYGLDLLNGGLKGADISYRLNLWGNGLTTTVLSGESALIRGDTAPTKVKNVKGLNLVWDGDWYTIRLGQITAEPQLGGGGGGGGPVMTGTEVYTFNGFGFTVDRADVVVQGEVVQRRSSQMNYAIGANAWYLLGGYRMGKYLPYVMVAKRKPDGATDVAPQDTKAVGLRWDAFSSAAIKFQFERVDTRGTAGASFITPSVAAQAGPPTLQGLSKPVDTFSVAVDFVF